MNLCKFLWCKAARPEIQFQRHNNVGEPSHLQQDDKLRRTPSVLLGRAPSAARPTKHAAPGGRVAASRKPGEDGADGEDDPQRCRSGRASGFAGLLCTHPYTAVNRRRSPLGQNAVLRARGTLPDFQAFQAGRYAGSGRSAPGRAAPGNTREWDREGEKCDDSGDRKIRCDKQKIM